MTSEQITTRPEGRPTKYIPEVIYPKIEEYLSSCGKEQTELPTIEGLALYIDVNADTIYTWAKEYPEFSEYLKKLANKQKNQLMNDGMYGGKEVNASMAIFLLKAIHGLSDGSNVNVNQQFNVGEEGKITYIIQTTNDVKEFNNLTSEPIKDIPVQETK